MFYIPKKEYEKIINSLLNTDTDKNKEIYINMKEYEKQQKDPEFIKNSIDIDTLQESIKVPLVNNPNIISDEFKDKLSDTISQINLIKHTSPHILFIKYRYAAENVFDVPEQLQNHDIKELSRKILSDIFQNTKIPDSIINDMIERFMIDETSKLTSIQGDFKSKIFKYYFSANLPDEIYKKVYENKQVSTVWKNIISKAPYNTSLQKDIYINKTIKNFLSKKQTGFTADALIKIIPTIKLSKSTINAIIEHNIDGSEAINERWLKAIMESKDVNKSTYKHFRKTTTNNKLKLFSDIFIKCYDDEQKRITLSRYVDAHFDKSKSHFISTSENIKETAKVLFNFLSDVMKTEIEKEYKDYSYLNYIENKLNFLSEKYGFKIKIPKTKTPSIIETPTITPTATSANLRMTMLDLNDEINKVFNDIGIDFENKEQLFDALDILEKNISTKIKDTKNLFYKSEEENLKKVNKNKKQTIKNEEIEL